MERGIDTRRESIHCLLHLYSSVSAAWNDMTMYDYGCFVSAQGQVVITRVHHRQIEEKRR